MSQPMRFTSKKITDERETLFYLDDKEYTIPVRFRPVHAFQYMQDLNRVGQEMALAKLLERSIGKDGMDALARSEDMEPEDMKKLITIVQEKASGVIEEATEGN